MMIRRFFVQWFSGADGHDRVLIGWDNTTRWGFSLPRWLSLQSRRAK
jgi:hypothetical protein